MSARRRARAAGAAGRPAPDRFDATAAIWRSSASTAQLAGAGLPLPGRDANVAPTNGDGRSAARRSREETSCVSSRGSRLQRARRVRNVARVGADHPADDRTQGGVWVPLAGTQGDLERALPGITVSRCPRRRRQRRGVDEPASSRLRNSISTVDAAQRRRAVPRAARPTSATRDALSAVLPGRALADSGIQTIRDLRGKAIAVQPRGNTAESSPATSCRPPAELQRRARQLPVVLYRRGLADSPTAIPAFTLGTTIPRPRVGPRLGRGKSHRRLTENVRDAPDKPRLPAVQLPATPTAADPGGDPDRLHGAPDRRLRTAGGPRSTPWSRRFADNLSAMTRSPTRCQASARARWRGHRVPIHPGARRF